jgi:hypothetical protein
MIAATVKRETEWKIRDFFKGKEELLNLFVNHPALDHLYAKVIAEIKEAERRCPQLINADVIRQVSHSFALVFCKQVLLKEEKRIISEAQMIAAQKKKDEHDYMMKMMEKTEASDHKEL